MAMRVVGVDAGKAALKLAVLTVDDNAALQLEASYVLPHAGDPLPVFAAWYREHRGQEFAALGATGLYGSELVAPALSGLPEDACLEAALELCPELAGPVNLAIVGARGYSALSRDERGQVRHVENDKCSAGTGETIVKNAGRFGLDIAAADALALAAGGSIPITARCSVFAKSELTHFANQGKPRDQLLHGYLDSIARHVAALLSRIRVPGPVYLIGGGSRLNTLRTCLSRQLETEVRVPEQALVLEAMGAAAIAARQALAAPLPALPEDPAALIVTKHTAFSVMQAAAGARGRVTCLPRQDAPLEARTQPSVLGLDLGSTGSKAMLTSIASGQPVLDLYDRTRGNPVEAAQRLVRQLMQEADADVRAIGVTGSGREAVATVLRAAYPQLAERICVVNEIVAHATAAIRCDEQHGRSLSVVEIGGQDAKFIQISGGQVVESNMNKACSAGTGSFLEEQAVFYGVDDIARFGELASTASRPPDLGQMCTVFVAEAATQAQAAGFALPDLFAGFQYSVIHNYLHRVMGQRSFGERIFFQGKPASGQSLAWTLAAVTGREVIVPPNPGAMGAWGIGLCAIDQLGQDTLQTASKLPLATFLSASISERGELRCQEKACATLCNIERTTVSVLGTKRQVFSGGACPKFEISTAARPKLDAQAPSAFDERNALLSKLDITREGAATVSVAEAGTLAGLLPWATTFLAELGLGVRVVRSEAATLERGEALSCAYDACAPVKVAHALAEASSGPLFMPKLVDLPAADGGGCKTCANEQAIPDVVGAALRANGKSPQIVAPVISFAHGFTSRQVLRGLRQAARELGADTERVPHAAARAAQAQAAYEKQLADIGRRTLDHGRLTRTPVIVVCGSLHVLFDRVIHAGIPGILRHNGVLALPMDCYPVPEHIDPLPRVPWADLNHALRVSLATRERGDSFPLLLSAFGCGPASFGEQIFETLMDGYPHTALETDGHGGNAGYVTRVQAFLHGVRKYDRRPAPLPRERLAFLAPAPKPGPADLHDARLLVMPIGDRLGALAAATYRSMGYDAIAAGPASSETLAHGRRDCSGKECLPYQHIWGAFRKQLTDAPPKKRTLLVQVAGQGACRNCMFSMKDRLSVEHMGLSHLVESRHFGAGSAGQAGNGPQGLFFGKFWASTVAWDILNQLVAYHRPAERVAGSIDALYARYCDELEALVGKPGERGLAGLLRLGQTRDAYNTLLQSASREFAQAANAQHLLPRVLLTGDIYVRVDEFANDHLVRKLNERGLRVLLDPVSSLVEYLVEERSAELLGLPTDYLPNKITRTVMRRTRKKLYEAVLPEHPFLYMPDVPDALRAGAPVLGRFPHSEAPITVGTYMQAVEQKLCEGVVVASPWGCSPALISEGLLRHQQQLPTLFVYADGTPLDERKLNGFAYRLREKGAHAAA